VPTLWQGGWLLWPGEPEVSIRHQLGAVLRATLKCGTFAWNSRLASGVVRWTLVAWIRASNKASLGGKEASCCG